ncbi:hypothetical protein [Jeongeupia naejangsanensis]|uniref:MalT-like TPR region domain-containing protein n=1 Tax=Jeongeupia naejangsanensis TaxID=613195 RepID=A0ABS2BLA8_9NEIS|nr:hypothetical protein [Jeongeupia naejangsanensis]MBM3116240.1 hypothetical protein [Jeongeupia naejangsanensis]
MSFVAESAAWYLQPGRQLAEIDLLLARSDAPSLKAARLIERGRCLEALWQPQSALNAYAEADALLGQADGALRCRTRLGAAAIHYAHADYAAALQAWQQALPLAADDALATSEALLGLGRVCQALGSAESALHFKAAALRAAGTAGDSRVQGMIALNVVASLNALGRYDEMAITLADAAQQITATPGRPFEAEWQVYASIVAQAGNRLRDAGRSLDTALALADGANNHWVRAFALLEQGKLRARLHDGRGALVALNAAREIGESMGIAHTLMDIHGQLAKVNEAQGNLGDALEHSKLHHQYYRWTHDGLNHNLLALLAAPGAGERRAH